MGVDKSSFGMSKGGLRRVLFAVAAAVLAGAGILAVPDVASAAPVGCTSDFYVATNSTSITQRTPAGTITSIPTGTLSVLSVALNPVDGVLYALSSSAPLGNHLFRVESDGTSTDLGAVTGLPGSTTYPTLAFGTDGTAWIAAGTLHRIDLATMTATTLTLSGGGVAGDIAFVDGQMYSFGLPNRISQVDTTTGVVTPTTVVGLGTVGAMWSSDGHLYVGQATVIREVVGYNTPTPSLTTMATLPVNAGDGASCASAPSPFLAAVDDDFTASPIDPATGGTTATAFVNDLASGAVIAPADVTATLTADGGLTGVTLNTDGTIAVPSGSVAGSYSLQYQLCLVASPTVCDLATAAILLRGAPSAPADPSLPVTGTDPAPIALGASLAILLGLLTLAVGQLRRPRAWMPGNTPMWPSNAL